MVNDKRLTRRKFLQASTAGLSFLYLPGIGRVKAQPFPTMNPDGYFGRLCYNENPLGPFSFALDALRDAASEANRYPDWHSSGLESDIATHHGLHPGNVCVGAGATKMIRLIADAFLWAGDEMITASPTYFQMAYEATARGASVVHVPVDDNCVIDLDGISQAVTSHTKLISLVNPNNSLGTCVNKADMRAFIESLPTGIVAVVDEAYHHYVHTPDYETCIPLVAESVPVIVVRTFSKVYGLAGARIGYSVASTQYTGQIGSSQMFATVSNVAQAAGKNPSEVEQRCPLLGSVSSVHFEKEGRALAIPFDIIGAHIVLPVRISDSVDVDMMLDTPFGLVNGALLLDSELVVAVDDQDIGEFTSRQLTRLFIQERTTLTLSIERDGDRFEQTLALRRLI